MLYFSCFDKKKYVQVRSLSCVSIFASITEHEKKHIWFIDSTGYYPVRAICIGGENILVSSSSLPNNHPNRLHQSTRDKEDDTPIPLSKWLNQRLLKEYDTSITDPSELLSNNNDTNDEARNTNDTVGKERERKSHRRGFQDITAKEGLKRILRILANRDVEEEENDDDDAIDTTTMRPPTRPIISSRTRFELATITLTTRTTRTTMNNNKDAEEDSTAPDTTTTSTTTMVNTLVRPNIQPSFVRYKIHDLFPNQKRNRSMPL
jgi:hypothetical protein